jgi:hypothetical protein
MSPKKRPDAARLAHFYLDSMMQAMLDAVRTHIEATDAFPRPTMTRTALVETCLVKLARDTTDLRPGLSALVEQYQVEYAGSKHPLRDAYLSENAVDAVNSIGIYLESQGLGQVSGRAAAGGLRIRRTGGFNQKMVIYVAVAYCVGLVESNKPD